jgi:hypothetical protein
LNELAPYLLAGSAAIVLLLGLLHLLYTFRGAEPVGGAERAATLWLPAASMHPALVGGGAAPALRLYPREYPYSNRRRAQDRGEDWAG